MQGAGLKQNWQWSMPSRILVLLPLVFRVSSIFHGLDWAGERLLMLFFLSPVDWRYVAADEFKSVKKFTNQLVDGQLFLRNEKILVAEIKLRMRTQLLTHVERTSSLCETFHLEQKITVKTPASCDFRVLRRPKLAVSDSPTNESSSPRKAWPRAGRTLSHLASRSAARRTDTSTRCVGPPRAGDLGLPA
jgi:hypothetical protein